VGFGDDLMLSGEARAMQARDPRPVVVYRKGRPFWREAWNGNPRFVHPDLASMIDHQRYVLEDGIARRPYQCKAKTTAERWAWVPYRPIPGELFLSDAELNFAAPFSGRRFVMIEPHIKPGASPNKDWGFHRWQQVVKLRPDLDWIQTGPDHVRPLSGVQFVPCPSVRHACAVLDRATAYVGPEGGMHHAAAALGKPAVVIFGGFISPDVTGYDTHRNLFTGGTACGWRKPCKHCSEAMDKITPEDVIANLEAILEPLRPAA
jgi:hypothetical protein